MMPNERGTICVDAQLTVITGLRPKEYIQKEGADMETEKIAPAASNSELIEALGATGDYFTRCGDCGQFVAKRYWVRRDNKYGYKHALCPECISNYDN